MAYYSFKRDLALSVEAVQLVMEHITDRGMVCHELEGKEEQKLGDIRVLLDDCEFTIEVKLDVMAESTGNLCFELSNGKRLTGILETGADEVFYVVPCGKSRRIFKFEIEKLRKYILDPPNVVMKKGGDKKKFDLALVNMHKIVEDGIPFEVVEIDAELSI